MTLPVTDTTDGVQFAVKVVPGAAADRIVGLLGDALKVQVAAPPERGRANVRLCAILAEALAVPLRSVEVHSGPGSPRKLVRVAGLTAHTLRERLGIPG